MPFSRSREKARSEERRGGVRTKGKRTSAGLFPGLNIGGRGEETAFIHGACSYDCKLSLVGNYFFILNRHLVRCYSLVIIISSSRWLSSFSDICLRRWLAGGDNAAAASCEINGTASKRRAGLRAGLVLFPVSLLTAPHSFQSEKSLLPA